MLGSTRIELREIGRTGLTQECSQLPTFWSPKMPRPEGYGQGRVELAGEGTLLLTSVIRYIPRALSSSLCLSSAEGWE